MKIVKTITETINYLNSLRNGGKSIGFVPTMGALHEGHLELLRKSKNENNISVCSIFVNPIQFNNTEDLKKYPRTMEKDINKLKSVNCDVLFVPEVNEIYPEENTKVYDFGTLDKVMEGKFRPGHFNGVAIVVKLLFDIVPAHRAYFGDKDFQQLAIVNEMVRQENLKIKVIPCPIVREKSGLAMSSRNTRLTSDELKIAPVIYKTLKSVKNKIKNHSISQLKEWAINELNNAKGINVEYFEIVDTENLQAINSIFESKHTIACVTVFLGKVRLIDNIRLT
jgi:pantoate--beta-alanine ligase